MGVERGGEGAMACETSYLSAFHESACEPEQLGREDLHLGRDCACYTPQRTWDEDGEVKYVHSEAACEQRGVSAGNVLLQRLQQCLHGHYGGKPRWWNIEAACYHHRGVACSALHNT